MQAFLSYFSLQVLRTVTVKLADVDSSVNARNIILFIPLLSAVFFFIVSAACSTVPSRVWSVAELLIIITFNPLFVWVSGKSKK